MKILQKLVVITATSLIIGGSVLSAQAGPLQGTSKYKASGTASVVGNSVKLGSNFRFSGGPDVYVAVKKKGKKVKLLGKLRKNSGAQSYKLPAGAKKNDFDQIILFCKRYNITMGTASIN